MKYDRRFIAGSAFGLTLALGALILLAFLSFASCGQDTVSEGDQTAGIEMWLDASGRPVSIVHHPGKPGDPVQVTIRDRNGKITEQATFDNLAEGLRAEGMLELPDDGTAMGDRQKTRESILAYFSERGMEVPEEEEEVKKK